MQKVLINKDNVTIPDSPTKKLPVAEGKKGGIGCK